MVSWSRRPCTKCRESKLSFQQQLVAKSLPCSVSEDGKGREEPQKPLGFFPNLRCKTQRKTDPYLCPKPDSCLFSGKTLNPLETLALRDVERFWLKKSNFLTSFVEIPEPLETARTAGWCDRPERSAERQAFFLLILGRRKASSNSPPKLLKLARWYLSPTPPVASVHKAGRCQTAASSCSSWCCDFKTLLRCFFLPFFRSKTAFQHAHFPLQNQLFNLLNPQDISRLTNAVFSCPRHLSWSILSQNCFVIVWAKSLTTLWGARSGSRLAAKHRRFRSWSGAAASKSHWFFLCLIFVSSIASAASLWWKSSDTLLIGTQMI